MEMDPNEEVQVTLTREECMRIDACLSALISVAEMAQGAGLPAALGLGESIPILKGVLPRLQEQYPHDDVSVHHIERMSSDTKTYQQEPTVELIDSKIAPDTPVSDLAGISNEKAKELFGTEYDKTIAALLGSLEGYTDYSHEEFHELLTATSQMLEQVIPMPENLTLAESRPYVVVSDLVTLGQLAHEMYLRQDQVEEHIGKPF